MNEQKIIELEKYVAAATATLFNPREAAEMLAKAHKSRKLRRGVAY